MRSYIKGKCSFNTAPGRLGGAVLSVWHPVVQLHHLWGAKSGFSSHNGVDLINDCWDTILYSHLQCLLDACYIYQGFKELSKLGRMLMKYHAGKIVFAEHSHVLEVFKVTHIPQLIQREKEQRKLQGWLIYYRTFPSWLNISIYKAATQK